MRYARLPRQRRKQRDRVRWLRAAVTHVYNFSSRTMSGEDAIAEIIQAIKRAVEAPRMRVMETKCGAGRVFADCGFADYALDEYEWAQHRGKPVQVDDPPWELVPRGRGVPAADGLLCAVDHLEHCPFEDTHNMVVHEWVTKCDECRIAHAMAVLLDRQLEQNAQADK